MSVDNHTPFPALAFRQYNMVGDMMGVVVARGTFKLGAGTDLIKKRIVFKAIFQNIGYIHDRF